MHHPDPASTCIGEEAAQLSTDHGWSSRELSRQIALLEAHLYENETKANKTINKIRHALLSVERLCDDRSSFYVGHSLAHFLLDFERASLLERRRNLAWLVIKTIRRIQARASRATLVRLKFLSELTSLTSPLPAYGAELSQYRHRFR